MRTLTPSQAANQISSDHNLRVQALIAEAYAERARVFAAGIAWVARKTVALARITAASLAKASARRRMIAELARLDDRMLADIGVQRSQIRAVVDAALASTKAASQPVSAEVRTLNPQAKRPAPAVTPRARAA